GAFGVVARYDGELMHLGAHAHTTDEGARYIRQVLPQRPSRESILGRAILEGRVVHVPDLQADPEHAQAAQQAFRARSCVAVPMLRDGPPIGAIAVGRFEVRPFSDAQITLLKTFADQAIIAIENVRLFKELEEKNKALTTAHAQVTESLDQHTATSEILSVISSSPTELQPVFDVIAKNAFRLCGGAFAILYRYDGALMSVVADVQLSSEGSRALRALYPAPPRTDHVVGLSIIEDRIVHTRDVSADPQFSGNRNPFMLTTPYKSSLVMPMRREGTVIGAIGVARGHVQPYSEGEIELLK